MLKKNILCFLFIFYSASSYSGVTNILHQERVNGCNIIIIHNAVKGQTGTIVVRGKDDDLNYCNIAEKTLLPALDQAMKHPDIDKLSEVRSIFLGRLVSYNWISAFISSHAATDPNWNKKQGRSVKDSTNKYVNKLLSSSEILTAFDKVMSKHQYRATRFSCEKILTNKDRLPVDAMCWINIKKNS
ncbi:MAG: hypothetical protein OEY00_10240 [Gammaproteobacteria bacterium]|nr:hypothetical protein [Gammaproteobacteria bacterium]